MKQQILEKLFNDKELSKEELVYISEHLVGDIDNVVPYNHKSTKSLEACGATNKDIDVMGKLFSAIVSAKEGVLSNSVERIENVIRGNPVYTRVIIVQCLKAFMEKNNDPLNSLLDKLLKGLRPPEE